ncbi:DUF928 domain-containing protein [Nostoc sp. CENA67]|uniref:DUF928 domain-containing protein n=1 Tax=Amazonocrinis nigriterrae CENA67 TaxID=2794033 RepID=A0A8J7HNR1_9NOST|nr:DUF928 domain-containing protein [Amazonocrinis nigriterrae]MBH8562822.1 DUF928 domain-containing protein [Amazonocrinis nigriterrae CENA67]
MGKLNLSKLTLGINILIITILTILPTQATIKPQIQKLLTTEINHNYLAFNWGNIFQTLRRKKVPGGGKPGDSVCTIAPQRLVEPHLQSKHTPGEILEIWSVNPVFIWYSKRSNIKQIELLQAQSKEVLWSQKIKPGQTSIIYNGKPLQPGETYLWKLYVPFAVEQTPKFKILELAERNKITNELQQLEAQIKSQGANAESITLKRANYFAEKGMWTDALQEIYAVPNPSLELKQIKQQIPSAEYCQELDAAKKVVVAN